MKVFNFRYLGILIMLIVAGYLAISSMLFINKHEIVKAKITEAKYFTSGDPDSADWYEMSLQIIPSGRMINGYYFDTGLTDPEFKAGQIVDLYYDAEDPLNSEIKNFWVQWGPALLTIFIMIFYILVMSVIYFYINKRKTGSPAGT